VTQFEFETGYLISCLKQCYRYFFIFALLIPILRRMKHKTKQSGMVLRNYLLDIVVVGYLFPVIPMITITQSDFINPVGLQDKTSFDYTCLLK